MVKKHFGQHEDCFGCKVQTVQVSPAATPTRTGAYRKPARTPDNSWEKGIPTDNRGMPTLLPGTFDPAGEKFVAQNRRLIEESRRRFRQGAIIPS